MTEKTLQKVFYVEDEEDIIAIAEIALSDVGGLSFKSCNVSKEAIGKALEFKPDLFLLDVMMPEVDGPTLLKQIRNTHELKETPVIFMTAKTQRNEVSQYIEMGALSVITKPFDPMTLAEQIRVIWAQHYG